MLLKEVELSASERSFILEAVQQNVRLDGRTVDQFRELDLSFGEEYGHARAKLGKTSVLVRISSDITKPRKGRESEGVFSIVSELNNMASPAVENGRQSELEAYLSRMLDKIARQSNAVETESLCLVAGSSAWTIRADVHVLDYDGGLLDCCCIALMAALRHFRRPEVTVRDGKLTVHGLNEKAPVPLNITTQPLSCTFNVFDDGKIMLLDPSMKEEQAGQGSVVVALNPAGELCLFSKMDGVPVLALKLIDCSNIALAKVKQHAKIISKKLEEDAKVRASRHPGAISSAANDR